MTDSRGVKRGQCSVSLCDCSTFKLSEETVVCATCGHPPVRHQNLSRDLSTRAATDGGPNDRRTDTTILPTRLFTKITESKDSDPDSDESESDHYDDEDSICSWKDCHAEAYFDVNTGESSLYCKKHIDQHHRRGIVIHHNVQRPTRGLQASPQLPPLQICKLPGCSKPCAVDPSNGELFDCCSRSHGRIFIISTQENLSQTGKQLTETDIPDDMKCTNPYCGRPKYQDNGQVYDFCGLTCRNNHYKLQKSKQPLISPIKASPMLPVSKKHCILPGCKLPRYYDQYDGDFKLFCGNGHRHRAGKIVLLELASDSQKYKKILNFFVAKWNPRKSKPPAATDIITIFRIFDARQRNIFRSHTEKLDNQTVEKYFHGTSIRCDIRSNKAACTDQKCGVCGISRRGFARNMIGSNIPRFMRFGKGFYLAPNSSKCHDYTQGIQDYRVMILCKVAPGNKYTVKNDQTKLDDPPQGYDSVYGAAGGALNYDEIVLYRNESILPTYCIVYRRDGIKKIAN